MGQLLFKVSGGDPKSPYLYGGLSLYGASAFLWIYSLKYLPLSKVYPFTFLTFAFVLLISYFLLGEKISLLNMVGVFLIVVGVVLTSL